MNVIRRLVLVLFCLISLTGTLITATYLGVNVKEIPGKISQIEQTDKEAETLKLNANIKSIKDAIQLFEAISLDLSAVTPLILFWFFASLFYNSSKLLLKSYKDQDTVERSLETAQNDDSFPFPPNYETTWIQLGFIGTLWGFLIIGIRMERARSGVSPDVLDILLKAFGTALISTFTAVVMVYVFCPIVKKFYRWALKIPYVDYSRIPDQISDKLAKLSRELHSTAEAVKSLNGKIVKLEKGLQRMHPKALTEDLKNIKTEISKARRDMHATQNLAEEKIKKIDDINKHMDKIYKTFDPLSQRLALRIERFENMVWVFKRTLLKSLKEGAIYTKEIIDTETRPFIKSVLESESRPVFQKMDDKIVKKHKVLNSQLKSLNEKLETTNESIASNFNELKGTFHKQLAEILRTPPEFTLSGSDDFDFHDKINRKEKKRFDIFQRIFRSAKRE